MSDQDGVATRSLHAGHDPNDATAARAPPLYQTTSYEFADADRAADLYALEADGHVYSRVGNPTVNVLERRLAALEGGPRRSARRPGWPPSTRRRRS